VLSYLSPFVAVPRRSGLNSGQPFLISGYTAMLQSPPSAASRDLGVAACVTFHALGQKIPAKRRDNLTSMKRFIASILYSIVKSVNRVQAANIFLEVYTNFKCEFCVFLISLIS
jgi:hypothetical protein